ncbi:MAG: hypothetical protein AAGD18_05380 [Actinomycetota bacterium]
MRITRAQRLRRLNEELARRGRHQVAHPDEVDDADAIIGPEDDAA